MTKEKIEKIVNIGMFCICITLGGLMAWFIIAAIQAIKINNEMSRKAPIEEFIRMDVLSTDFVHPDTVYVYKDTTTNIIHISKGGIR